MTLRTLSISENLYMKRKMVMGIFCIEIVTRGSSSKKSYWLLKVIREKNSWGPLFFTLSILFLIRGANWLLIMVVVRTWSLKKQFRSSNSKQTVSWGHTSYRGWRRAVRSQPTTCVWSLFQFFGSILIMLVQYSVHRYLPLSVRQTLAI